VPSLNTLPTPTGATKSDLLVDQLVNSGRYTLLRRPQFSATLSDDQRQRADRALQQAMSEVPPGDVWMRPWRTAAESEDFNPPDELVQVERFHIDKYAVTNRLFLEFVDADGYRQPSHWRESVWPLVSEFVDMTGRQGPRFWSDGTFPAEHPVVGISWFEADAYARWIGKRLPYDFEWVKAASSPISTAGSGPIQRTFPWGPTFDSARANLWSSGLGRTAPVDTYSTGSTPAGVYQMVGNVWEWISSEFRADVEGVEVEAEPLFMSIRGASFATYFDSQAGCQVQSADCPFARKWNIGLRCAIGACDVAETTEGPR
jgi:iron(II)-dependent oxidoreductase